MPIRRTGVIVLSKVTNANEIPVESKFNFASPCITDTLSLPSIPSYTTISTGSYTVLLHLFGFLSAAFQYLDVHHVDVLFRAVVNSRAVESAVVKDSNPEPTDTSSELNWVSSGEILDLGTLKVILDKFFHISESFHQNEFLQINFSQAITLVDFLCKCRKKCYRNFLLDKFAKSESSKLKPLPFYGPLNLRF